MNMKKQNKHWSAAENETAIKMCQKAIDRLPSAFKKDWSINIYVNPKNKQEWIVDLQHNYKGCWDAYYLTKDYAPDISNYIEMQVVIVQRIVTHKDCKVQTCWKELN